MNERFTVIIPTFDHGGTIVYGIKSILNQKYQNFEIVVIGDGASEETSRIMHDFCHQDNRISYLPHVKGLGHGELYRHDAILKSTGDYICYLGDDDIWLTDHLTTIKAYLGKFDFVHTCHTGFTPEGKIYFPEANLESARIQEKMLNEKWNFFGPTCVAHTKEAYLKLPFGWRPRPEGMWSDLFMWRQWIDQKRFKFLTIPCSTTLHFPSSLRPHTSISERLIELDLYYKKSLSPDFSEIINKQLIKDRIDYTLNNNGDLTNTIGEIYKKLGLINELVVIKDEKAMALRNSSLENAAKLNRDYFE